MLESNDNTNFIIRNALEYYDKYQPEINNFLEKVDSIEFINNNTLTDQIIFYDSKKNILFESNYEILSIYLPENKSWKWSWSVPSLKKKHTFLCRKLLDYSFNLDLNNYFLKSLFTNSNIKLVNDLQLSINLALAANLSKKPFILKIYSSPINLDKEKIYNTDEHNIYPYKKIINDKNSEKFLHFYLIILDFEIN